MEIQAKTNSGQSPISHTTARQKVLEEEEGKVLA
jgi:hypothetical protein